MWLGAEHTSITVEFFTTDEGPHMLEGFGQNISYLSLRPGLAVTTIWALFTDEDLHLGYTSLE